METKHNYATKRIPDDSVGLTLVIPGYNEVENIRPLLQALSDFAEIYSDLNKVLYVDDGSTDKSVDELLREKAKYQNLDVELVRLRRNLGKSYALMEGFKRARTQIVATLDADLQDDPKELPKLIDRLNQDYDLVSGWRRTRRDGLDKRIPSFVYNRITALLSGIKLHDFNSGIKVYRKVLIDKLNLYGEHHRYIPVIAVANGFRVTELPVTHSPRRYGKSKFGADRILRGFFDFLTIIFISKFSKNPMHFFGAIGSVLFIVGVLISLWLTYVQLFVPNVSVNQNPNLRLLVQISLLLMISGIQFFSTGLIGELITSFNRQRDKNEVNVIE